MLRGISSPLVQTHVSSHAELNWWNLPWQRTWFIAVVAGVLSGVTAKDKLQQRCVTCLKPARWCHDPSSAGEISQKDRRMTLPVQKPSYKTNYIHLYVILINSHQLWSGRAVSPTPYDFSNIFIACALLWLLSPFLIWLVLKFFLGR